MTEVMFVYLHIGQEAQNATFASWSNQGEFELKQ